MNEQLISYLEDNKYQILEVWLTEVELSPPDHATVPKGGLPFIYLEAVFKDILKCLRDGKDVEFTGIHKLSDFMDNTFTCHTKHPQQSLACFEILMAAQGAFSSVMTPLWDTANEFTEDEHEFYSQRIKKAIAFIMHTEIKKCAQCADKLDCPFDFRMPLKQLV